MAVTSDQATQYENQATRLIIKADVIIREIDLHVTTGNQEETAGRALEAEAIDTLNAITSFLNRGEVRDGQSDPIFGTRVIAAVEKARKAKVIAQSAVDTIRESLSEGRLGPGEKTDTDSVGLIALDDKAGGAGTAATQNPEAGPELNSQSVPPGTNANKTQLLSGTALEDMATATFKEDRLSTSNGLTGQGDVKYPSAFEQDIKTTTNSLAGMASYTYQISIYLMTPEQFNIMSRQENKTVAGLSLLIQSGGAGPVGEADLNGAIRNEFFDLDYFIEDLEMESMMPKAVRGATNQTKLNFKIIEPYGFTFIQRLKNATEKFFGTLDFVKQHYLMTIRFHGYDQEGNQITSQSTVDSDRFDNNRSDRNSVNEKFIPFKFANITTRAATGPVEYVCEALPVNHFEALSQKRATIPFQVEIKGQTLQNLFMGKSDLDPTLSGGTISALSEKNLISEGLIDALNKQQEAYVKNKSQGIADVYKVTFEGSNIGEQKVMPPGGVAKPRTASTIDGPSSLIDSRGQVEKETFTVSVTAGQQLQQSIDGILKTSQYITNQQKVQYDVVSREWQDKASNKVLAWYKLTTKVLPLDYDRIRKDYAYSIEVIVTPQQVTDTKSTAFPKDRFRGVHKKFNYWFTGENTEVIDYEVEFNALYYTSMSSNFSNEPRESAELDQAEAEADNQPSRAVGPADQSTQNSVGKSGEEAARAASVLYSPVDFAQMEMTVYGDPDFIQQGDIFYRAGKEFGPYLEDGSVNYDSQEVFCEVFYNTIEDYNEDTGEAEPKEILLKSVDQYVRTNTKGLIYQIIAVKNIFSKGMFTQVLQGLAVDFPSRASVEVGLSRVEKGKKTDNKSPKLEDTTIKPLGIGPAF